MIYPGTTPDIPFVFPETIDLSEITQVWVTFKSKRSVQKVYEKTYDISEVDIDNANHTITVHMTQLETLAMEGSSSIEAQIRLLGPGSKARATTIVTIPVERVLKGGVVTNAD